MRLRTIIAVIGALFVLLGCESVSETRLSPNSEHTVVATKEPPIAVKVKAVGEIAPDFKLPDVSGSLVSLSTLLSENRLVVLVFYRGYF